MSGFSGLLVAIVVATSVSLAAETIAQTQSDLPAAIRESLFEGRQG